jgi:Na+-translocating ferredoxin:NAD+ oxidoreductase RnfD subunit
MDIKPYRDRLIAWAKNAIVEISTIFIGCFFAVVIAGHWYERHSWYWFQTAFVVFIAYVIVLWLLKFAWSRYRRSPN